MNKPYSWQSFNSKLQAERANLSYHPAPVRFIEYIPKVIRDFFGLLLFINDLAMLTLKRIYYLLPIVGGVADSPPGLGPEHRAGIHWCQCPNGAYAVVRAWRDRSVIGEVTMGDA